MGDVIIDGNTGANRLVILDSTGKIPAVDGSLVTLLAGGNFSTGTIPIAQIDTGAAAGKVVKLDGNAKLPAVSGAALTGIAGATKNANDPSISTNPSGGVGTEWQSTTTGEIWICTDATAGANEWVSTGGRSGDIQPWNYGGTQYGFSSGGYGNTHETDIEKFSFTSDINSVDTTGDLTVGNVGGASSKSSTHGYITGGSTAPGTASQIQKFAFVSTSNATNVGDLTAARRWGGGTTTPDYGYGVTGGASSNLGLNRLDKYSHTSDINATLIGGVYEPRQEGGSHSSATHGYISGGRHGPAYLNSIEKHPFASDSDSVDSANLVTSTYRGGAGTGSETNGYHFGGFDGSGNRTDQIQKFPYASDTNATDIANLTTPSRDGAASASASYAYKYGGDSPSPNGAAINVIEKWPHASNTNAVDVGDLIEAKYSLCCGHGY